jgi:hypothetical protein
MNHQSSATFLNLGYGLVAPQAPKKGPKEAAESEDLCVQRREFKTTRSFEQVVAALERPSARSKTSRFVSRPTTRTTRRRLKSLTPSWRSWPPG